MSRERCGRTSSGLCRATASRSKSRRMIRTAAASCSANDRDSMPDLPFVQLFTDGACRGNPGPGGWAYILRHPATHTEKEVSGGLAQTTNNQMELAAVIHGLEALKSRSSVEVIPDSQYVAKGCFEWMPTWK